MIAEMIVNLDFTARHAIDRGSSRFKSFNGGIRSTFPGEIRTIPRTGAYELTTSRQKTIGDRVRNKFI